MTNREATISKFVFAFSKYYWLRMIVFLGITLSVWSLRFPFIFRKIYGEDGELFLTDALKYKFPTDLFKPAAGYSTLIMRIGGRFASIFPLENAAVAGGIFTAICLSVLAAGLFQYNNFIGQNFWGRLLLSLSFIFLPLASFSAVGNITNLYIYFMTASAVFLYYHEKTSGETLYKSLILFIAALSLPLTIFLLPIMLHRIYLDKKASGYWKILKSDFTFVIGIIFQFIFIAFTSFGERAPHSPQSLFKVIYLYLERGIGISIIPKWGFISGTSGDIHYENTASLMQSSIIRLVIVLTTVTVLALIFYRNRFGISKVIRAQIWFIMFLGIIYSILVGLFFNPEPRYMIFTSFLTCWVFLLLLESQSSSKFRFISTTFLSIVLALGLTASIHRSQGPEWKPELAKARQICVTSTDIKEVQVRTLPMDANWKIVIPCEKLR